jgi:hypothetical protein
LDVGAIKILLLARRVYRKQCPLLGVGCAIAALDASGEHFRSNPTTTTTAALNGSSITDRCSSRLSPFQQWVPMLGHFQITFAVVVTEILADPASENL